MCSKYSVRMLTDWSSMEGMHGHQTATIWLVPGQPQIYLVVLRTDPIVTLQFCVYLCLCVSHILLCIQKTCSCKSHEKVPDWKQACEEIE